MKKLYNFFLYIITYFAWVLSMAQLLHRSYVDCWEQSWKIDLKV